MKASLNSLHHQITDWLRELDFYKEETAILTKRLEEVISKNTIPEITAQVEHFQNKFILFRELTDTLRHDITAREQEVEKRATKSPEHTNEHFSVAEDKIFIAMADFIKNVADTRLEFNRFLAKVL